MGIEALLVGLVLVGLAQLGLWASKRSSTSSMVKKPPKMMSGNEVAQLREVAAKVGERDRQERKAQQQRQRDDVAETARSDAAMWMMKVRRATSLNKLR